MKSSILCAGDHYPSIYVIHWPMTANREGTLRENGNNLGTTGDKIMDLSEGLRIVRLMMVLSSLTPLFLLWAIRGMQQIPDKWLCVACGILVLGPNLILYVRWFLAKARGDKKALAVARADDHREHLLVYLFATLLPLYEVSIGSARNLAAVITALLFIVFLFWHLNLHYVNVFFAVSGYRVFTINPAGGEPVVLLTKRSLVTPNSKIQAYRLSNTVFVEVIE